jgi:uncharacterized membrane protein
MRKQAITLGRIGILLPIASIIPIIGVLAGLASLILLLLSHYNFSKIYTKPGIFKNALTGFIVQIGGNIIGGAIIAVGVATAAVSLSGSGMDSMGFQYVKNLLFESGLTISGAILILAGLIVGFYFIFKALKDLAEQSGVTLFKTAGLLYFIGAIGIIVFFLGFLAIIAAWIIHIIAYFTVPLEDESIEASS